MAKKVAKVVKFCKGLQCPYRTAGRFDYPC